MKLLVILALVTVTLAGPNKMAPLLAEDSPTAIDGEYIVVLNEEASKDTIEAHMTYVRGMLNETSTVEFVYNIGEEFRGYAAKLSEQELFKIRTMSVVKYVERSQIVKVNADCVDQPKATWGIVRTTERDWDFGMDTDYSYYSNDGEGVDAYIIDTGIYIQHEEFGGRAKWGYDAVDNSSPEKDGNGHGTHVAGTVIGNKYGLAKKATAIAVRVLNDNGSGSTAGVMAGVNWVAGQHSDKKKSLANMSLGGGYSSSMNDAVDAAVNKGVHFAVAAGNSNADACNFSPASAKLCVTVGATEKTDARSSFSNYGTCVDIFAPGSSITSAWIGSPNAINTISGTSMASPHVAGVMAKLLTTKDYTTAEMKEVLLSTATENKMGNPGTGSPNLLVFKDCE